MKKIFVFFLFLITTHLSAQTAYFFYMNGCLHCKEERLYLQKLQKKHPSLIIKSFEVSDEHNALLLEKVAHIINIKVSGFPILIISNTYFVGYVEETTSLQIEQKLQQCIEQKCTDYVEKILTTSEAKETPNFIQAAQSKIVSLPILGKIDVHHFSLPLLTVIIGLLDGFNPCAMWTLIFLISLLLGMNNRKRMWILGAAFIITSAAVYFLFMAAWLNLILFLGFIFWVRIIIGIIALSGGIYGVKEFIANIKNKEIVCKVTNTEERQKVFSKIRAIVEQNSFWLALGGIILLAFMVNLVELICSAGFPAVYTQVLALNELATWQYYLYLLLYTFFFMLDDMLVFIAAMITLQITGLSTKYVKYAHLIGGTLMIIIGILLIFKPQYLMFG